jgi:DNA-binding NarL/FixJ family response regulator
MQSPVSHQKKCHVLLADDHLAIRTALRDLLAFYEDIEIVGEAHDGIQAIDLTGASHPDLVIMDINMPTMNGLEATRHIKRSWPRTVIIGFTANTDTVICNAMLQAGAVACLEKAQAYDALYPVIQKYCEYA